MFWNFVAGAIIGAVLKRATTQNTSQVLDSMTGAYSLSVRAMMGDIKPEPETYAAYYAEKDESPTYAAYYAERL